MAVTNDLKGARLEFVCRPIKGNRKRNVTSFDAEKKKLVTTEVVEKGGGYMLYLPTGNSYRLTEEQVTRRSFLREPDILGFEGVQNKDTPAGRFKFAITESARMKAYKEMEDQVVKACTGRAAVDLITENVKEAA